jgi:hypothetical protein
MDLGQWRPCAKSQISGKSPKNLRNAFAATDASLASDHIAFAGGVLAAAP